MDTEARMCATTPRSMRGEPESRPTQMEMGDWLTLLAAVTGRLRMTAARQAAVTNGEHALDASGRLRADVLDCVDELDRLHAALARLEPSR